MENKRNGWALGLGIFSGAYQLVAGLILILFCSKMGGIPYGVALIVTGLLCGLVTFFAGYRKWAQITHLMLGVASIVLVFVLGFAIDKLLVLISSFIESYTYVSVSSMGLVPLLRIIGFHTGLCLMLSAIWTFAVPEGKERRFVVSTIIYKVLLFLGVAFFAALSALTYWQLTANAAFTEWLYGLLGDETLTGSALIEAQILLRSDYVLWVRKFLPLFQGIGILLIALMPTYAWYLDGEGILFDKKSVLGTVLVIASGVPFLAVAELVLVGKFLSSGSIFSLIFAILTVVAYAALWFFFYALPVIRGKREKIFCNEAAPAVEQTSVEEEVPAAEEA